MEREKLSVEENIFFALKKAGVRGIFDMPKMKAWYIAEREKAKQRAVPIDREYFEREIAKAKKDAYADALYQYRHNKLIDYIDYLETKNKINKGG